MKIRMLITVTGKVQAVGFRRYAREAAVSSELAGWVKNLFNGDVQLCIEGEKEKVREFIDWCHKGPPMARIERVMVEPSVFRGEYTDFTVIQ